jgi:hypothetical protein
MIGAVAAGSKKRAAGGVTLDDIFARHTWAVWWDGAHGVNAGAGTWTDRVSGVVANAYDATLSTVTVGAATAVRCDLVPGAGWLDVEPIAAAKAQPMRLFIAGSFPATASAGRLVSIQTYEGSVDYLYVSATDDDGKMSYVTDAGAETVSTRSGTSFDNGVHVVRMEYNATHASHVMRVDGVAYTTAASTADITLNADLSGVYFGDYYGGLLDVAAVFWCPYASINDTQAAQVETDLLTIMGL